MARIIWSGPGNPPRAIATALGINRSQLRQAIHAIKNDAGLRPRDSVKIWSDGWLTDDRNEWIGNIFDEI
jgi:hypothetical protein